MKKLVIHFFGYLAAAVIGKYKPRIVAITGSVGKTTTKEMIVTVLTGTVSLRASDKNFNNELGLPLTILGCQAPGRSLVAWLRMLWRAVWLLSATRVYPRVLVLEMGADKPGDIAYLTRLAPPDVAVLTALGISHAVNFPSPTEIVREKSYIFLNRKPGGIAILNEDDPAIATIIGRAKPPVLTYGFSDGAEVRGSQFTLAEVQGQWGIQWRVKYQDQLAPLIIPGALSQEQALAALAALAVGIQFNVSLITAAQRLRQFQAPKGRMRLLTGLYDSVLIDDTYNAAPQSVRSALTSVTTIARLKKMPLWIILGDMLELGKFERSGHEDVGRLVAEVKPDRLLTIGQRAQHIGLSALQAGLAPESQVHFKNHEQAIAYLRKYFQAPAVVLVKGSQGARMEKISKVLLADQTRASELLVRQDAIWLHGG